MRDGAPDEVLAGACTWQATVTSWLGGRLLAARVPIASGRITGDVGDDVIETLSITVPRFAAPEPGTDVIDWRPASTDAPLARYGQILDVTIVVSSVITGQAWETRIGRYQIKDWTDDDEGTLTVKGESLLARPRDDKMLTLTSPTGTLASEVRRLLPAGMGASFDPALTDRAAPAAMSWSKDRLKNLQEIAQAWPALLRIDPWGQVAYRAPLPDVPVPVLTLRDGRGGTLINAPRTDTRSGAYNRVIASSSSTDAEDVQGVASITSGPMSVTGDYGVVAREWSSPLIENTDQAEASAQTMLSNSTRPALAVPARIAPDPRIELDDPVEILRGARGRMAVVPATYTPWVEQHRNLWTYPQPSSVGLVSDGYRWGSHSTGTGAVTLDSEGWARVDAGTGTSLGMRSSNWQGAAGLIVPGAYVLSLELQSSPGQAVPSIQYWTYMNGGTDVQSGVLVAPQVQPDGRVAFPITVNAPAERMAIYLRAPKTSSTAWFRVRRSQLEAGGVSTPYVDGSLAPDGDLERTRWLGASDASASVTETRQLLVPEHRVWVTEPAEDTPDADRRWGWVTAYDLPLTVDDGDMRVDVGLPS